MNMRRAQGEAPCRPAPVTRAGRRGLDIIVTRHATSEALLRQWLEGDGRRLVVVRHVDEQWLTRPHWTGRPVDWRGVRFFGVFPLWLAAAIERAGAACWSLDVRAAAGERGRPIDAAALHQHPPLLVRYRVTAEHRMAMPRGASHNAQRGWYTTREESPCPPKSGAMRTTRIAC